MLPAARLLWIAILLLAFVLRAGFAVQWHGRAEAEGQAFRLGDSHSYWTLAEQIARGQPYQYGSENAQIFRAPLYPVMLAPLTWIPDRSTAILAARLVGCLLGTLAVGLLVVLASRLGGPCAGWAAGAIGAVYPAAIGMSGIVLSEALFMPLMVLHLLLWQAAWTADAKDFWRPALLAGVCAGLATLARPSWLLFLPFAGVLGVLLGSHRRRHLAIAGISLVGLSITMSPWWFRNAYLTGRFVPTTLQVGPSLYDGLHAGATGASDEGMAFMQALLAEQLEEDRTSREPPPSTLEFRIHQRALSAAAEWSRQHPLAVANLAWVKFRRTWSLWPDGGETSSTTTRLLLTIGCFGVLALAATGTLLALRPVGWVMGICWLPCLYFTLLHMVFVGSIRYREPAVFVLAAVAACALTRLARCAPGPHTPPRDDRLQSVQGSASVSNQTDRPNGLFDQ